MSELTTSNIVEVDGPPEVDYGGILKYMSRLNDANQYGEKLNVKIFRKEKGKGRPTIFMHLDELFPRNPLQAQNSQQNHYFKKNTGRDSGISTVFWSEQKAFEDSVRKLLNQTYVQNVSKDIRGKWDSFVREIKSSHKAEQPALKMQSRDIMSLEKSDQGDFCSEYEVYFDIEKYSTNKLIEDLTRITSQYPDVVKRLGGLDEQGLLDLNTSRNMKTQLDRIAQTMDDCFKLSLEGVEGTVFVYQCISDILERENHPHKDLFKSLLNRIQDFVRYVNDNPKNNCKDSKLNDLRREIFGGFLLGEYFIDGKGQEDYTKDIQSISRQTPFDIPFGKSGILNDGRTIRYSISAKRNNKIPGAKGEEPAFDVSIRNLRDNFCGCLKDSNRFYRMSFWKTFYLYVLFYKLDDRTVGFKESKDSFFDWINRPENSSVSGAMTCVNEILDFILSESRRTTKVLRATIDWFFKQYKGPIDTTKTIGFSSDDVLLPVVLDCENEEGGFDPLSTSKNVVNVLLDETERRLRKGSKRFIRHNNNNHIANARFHRQGYRLGQNKMTIQYRRGNIGSNCLVFYLSKSSFENFKSKEEFPFKDKLYEKLDVGATELPLVFVILPDWAITGNGVKEGDKNTGVINIARCLLVNYSSAILRYEFSKRDWKPDSYYNIYESFGDDSFRPLFYSTLDHMSTDSIYMGQGFSTKTLNDINKYKLSNGVASLTSKQSRRIIFDGPMDDCLFVWGKSSAIETVKDSRKYLISLDFLGFKKDGGSYLAKREGFNSFVVSNTETDVRRLIDDLSTTLQAKRQERGYKHVVILSPGNEVDLFLGTKGTDLDRIVNPARLMHGRASCIGALYLQNNCVFKTQQSSKSRVFSLDIDGDVIGNTVPLFRLTTDKAFGAGKDDRSLFNRVLSYFAFDEDKNENDMLANLFASLHIIGSENAGEKAKANPHPSFLTVDGTNYNSLSLPRRNTFTCNWSIPGGTNLICKAFSGALQNLLTQG